MKERPILFKGEMVKAILEGRKTQTRRIIKPQPEDGIDLCHPYFYTPGVDKNGELIEGPVCFGTHDEYGDYGVKCPYGGPGERLWVRETFEKFCQDKVLYRADGENQKNNIGGDWHKWRPSIHMPRWASRINLKITNVRVEKLHDISESDSKAEGVGTNVISGQHRTEFVRLWTEINEKRGYPWCDNPWVWVVEFKVIK